MFSTTKPKCESEFETAHQKIKEEIKLWPNKCSSAKLDWILSYLAEESLGTAILQREHRLVNQHSANKDNHGEDTQEKPPAYSSRSQSEMEQELTRLREEYWKHHCRMSQLADKKPDAPNVEELELLRQHRNRHNRSFAWVMDRTKCADLGGCCGRPCGCCERALRTYLRPSKDGGDVLAQVPPLQGHCTVECACCIRFRGCYTPHPRLPKPSATCCEDINI